MEELLNKKIYIEIKTQYLGNNVYNPPAFVRFKHSFGDILDAKTHARHYELTC